MRPKLHSLSALATELGLDRRTIAKRLATVPPDGRISGHDAWLLATAWPALLAAERGPSASTAEDERRRLVAAQADLAELRLARERGEYLHRDDVRRAWETTFRNVRDLLRQIPMAVVDKVMAASEDGRPAVHAVLRYEIDDALTRASTLPVDDDGKAGGDPADDDDEADGAA